MKKVLIIVCFIMLLCAPFIFKHDMNLNYSKLPSLNIMLPDSSTIYNTQNISVEKPTILIYFSPDCDHCQEQTRAIIKNINYLRNAEILLLSNSSIFELNNFIHTYQLNHYKNIIIGNDYNYSFFKFFNIKSFPYVVVYNNKKELVKLYKGEIGIDKIIEAINS